jgi:hypothetical protein
MALAILAHEFRIQTLGHVRVHLDGAALPFAAQRILQGVLDLRAVERALARQILELATRCAQTFGQRVLGLVPGFIGADALFGRVDRRYRMLVKPKSAYTFCSSEVKAVTSAWIWSSVQKMWPSSCVKARTRMMPCSAGGLVAVAVAELAKAQRQIAIALDALLEDDDVARAVHRLEGIFTLFRIGGEHVFAVLVPVAGLLPQGLVQNLRALTSW